MKKFGRIIKAVVFIIVCCTCVTVVSKVLEYEYEMQPNLAIKEFYKQEDDSVQMIIIGSSHTTLGFSPMEFYKQTKITSFNLSTAKQPVELSYHLLKESLKKQQPTVVLYDVANLFYTKKEVQTAKFRYIMDSMPLSENKIELAAEYARYNTNNDKKIFSMGEALCPIYYYHDRWKELDEEEFDINKNLPELKGQVIRTYITSINCDMDRLDSKLEKKLKENPKAMPKISNNNLTYLKKIKKLCDDNNMKLVLTSTPTNRWNTTKRKIIEQVSKEYNLDFVDLNLPDGQLLDYSTDMADGNHVNASGALKTTKYLSDYIVKHYWLKGKVCQSYEDDIKYYDAYYNNMIKYGMETDFNKYIKLLNDNKDKLEIFICGKGDITAGLSKKDIKQLNALGCKEKFAKSSYENSYVAVIDQGKLTYENTGKQEISHTLNLKNNSVATLYSNGNNENGKASININNKKYAINGSGINIVVYDKESGIVVDSVSFNTQDENKKWWRSGERSLERFMFKSYKDWVLENY